MSQQKTLENIEEQQYYKLIIRYDGLDADNHQIDLFELGKSVQGISRIIRTIAQYSLTNNFDPELKQFDCKILAAAPQENCFSIEAIIKVIDSSPLFYTTLGGVFVILFTHFWQWASGAKEEVKFLKEAYNKQSSMLEQKLENHSATIQKMYESLVDLAKDAIKPIGNSCDTVRFGDKNKKYFVEIDKNDKEKILENNTDVEITPQEKLRVTISELDMKLNTCKISLVDDLLKRFRAKIADPQIEIPNNKYVLAMASKKMVNILAKKKLQNKALKEYIIIDIE